MDYAQVLSRSDHGLDCPIVHVEVHLANGLPAFAVVGMAETAVRESRDRVRSALLNSHFEFPDRRITVNLAPADLPKSGGRFDLPIALGILCASGQLEPAALQGTECLGELALDGGLRDIRGTLAAVIAATQQRHRVALPAPAAARSALVPDARLCSAPDLLALCAVLRGRAQSAAPPAPHTGAPDNCPDLSAVLGQLAARRALEIAAAGSHNLLFTGPPGTGKSLLASSLPGILPRPEPREQLTLHALYDLQGEVAPAHRRPFRAPHHSASAAALIGGGSIPRPGEVSLAHGGVLFLDELPEFSRHALDMLREPLETGEIALARARCRLRYPARFQLLAAMNPCPCGYAGDPSRPCRCSAAQRLRYAARVSGPLLDRIDLCANVHRESAEDLLLRRRGECSARVRERVTAALDRQLARQGAPNARLGGEQLLEHCKLEDGARELLRGAAERLRLSARGVQRCLRVARTVADLGARDRVDSSALGEALAYREQLSSSG